MEAIPAKLAYCFHCLIYALYADFFTKISYILKRIFLYFYKILQYVQAKLSYLTAIYSTYNSSKHIC